MTIQIPPKNYFDKLLEKFKINRKIEMPKDIDYINSKYGNYFIIKLKYESYHKCLLRNLKLFIKNSLKF